MPAPLPIAQPVYEKEPLRFRHRTVEEFAGAREGAKSDSHLVRCVVLIV